MRAKKKWYEGWSSKFSSPDSYGLCHVEVTLPHSATEQKVFRVDCAPDSPVRQMVMLLECTLTELNARGKDQK